MSGVTLSFVGVLLMIGAIVASASRYTSEPGTQIRETRSESAVRTDQYQPFHGYVHFGGLASESDSPAPPSGPERLRGKITLDGAGVEGAELSVTLNGKYEVENLKSDSRGVFEIPLPAGTWRINNIVVSDWDGRPRGRDLVLYAGHEPTKGEGQYIRHDFSMESGLPVSLPAAADAMAVEIELRDVLPMKWPPRSDLRGDGAGDASLSDADLSSAVIDWEPVAGASEYEVQISHVERDDTSTRYMPILMRRLAGSALSLASLPQRSVSGGPADEYSVHVYAFDAKGKLLTESSSALADRLFKLTGETRLGKEEYSSRRSDPKVISPEYETNGLRLSLVTNLLEQKQFDEARRVLDQVTEDAPRGRANALRGRLAALQGDCATAMKLFDKAESEGGAGCVPIEDRTLCAASQK